MQVFNRTAWNYVDNGTGETFRISWDADVLYGNAVDSYDLDNNGVQQTNYLAFRRFELVGNTKFPKYGWIEIDCTDKNNPKLIRWAMQ